MHFAYKLRPKMLRDKPPAWGMPDPGPDGRQHRGGRSQWGGKGDARRERSGERRERAARCLWGCCLGGGLSPALHPTAVLGPWPGAAGSRSTSTYSTSRFRMVLPADRTSATLDTIGS